MVENWWIGSHLKCFLLNFEIRLTASAQIFLQSTRKSSRRSHEKGTRLNQGLYEDADLLLTSAFKQQLVTPWLSFSGSAAGTTSNLIRIEPPSGIENSRE